METPRDQAHMCLCSHAQERRSLLIPPLSCASLPVTWPLTDPDSFCSHICPFSQIFCLENKRAQSWTSYCSGLGVVLPLHQEFSPREKLWDREEWGLILETPLLRPSSQILKCPVQRQLSSEQQLFRPQRRAGQLRASIQPGLGQKTLCSKR